MPIVKKFFYVQIHARLLAQITTPEDIEKESKRTIEALYGNGISDFKIREVFALPEFGPRVAWDVQVTFNLEGKKKHCRSGNSRKKWQCNKCEAN